MSVTKWTFTDEVLSEEYTFEVNPNEGGTATLSKNMQYTNTAAPNGRVLAFEGRPSARENKFTGTILTESQYTAMEHWFNKRNQIVMTDDLGRSSSIYITKFEATRVRAYSHPWKHTYEVDYVIIDWDA